MSMHVASVNLADTYAPTLAMPQAESATPALPAETRMLFHDMRKLLQGIVGPMDTLEMALDVGDLTLARTSVGRLKDNAGRVVEMLGSLTASPTGNVVRTTHCDVAEVAEDVVESLAPSLKQKRIEVRRRIAAPVTASVHETDLYRILLNLLVNAIDATNGRGGAITVGAKPIGHDWVQVSVSDKGDGIAKRDLAHLFEEGYTTKADRGGNGLGLAVVKRIAESYNGTVRAWSRPGQGARFTVRLPNGHNGNGKRQKKVWW